MFNFKENIQVKGHFKIEKFGPSGYEVHEQDNLVTDFAPKYFLYGYGHNYSEWALFGWGNQLVIGSGSAKPQTSDKNLTTPMWTVNLISSQPPVIHDDFKGVQISMTFQIPADTNYVGTIRELGLRVGTSGSTLFLLTHALLSDAEGNPYEIEKTDLDHIIITYVVDATCSNYYMIGLVTANGLYCIKNLYKLHYQVAKAAFNFFYPAIHDKKAFFKPVDAMNYSQLISGAIGDSQIIYPKVRLQADNYANGHYILSITEVHQPGCYGINFPNTDIMPPATLTDYSIGLGDGQTKEFIPPIPLWDEDTEEIYVNNVLQQRNVDYTCDCRHNLQMNEELMPMYHAIPITEQSSNSHDNFSCFIQPGDLKNISTHVSYVSNQQIRYSYMDQNGVTVNADAIPLNGCILEFPIEYDFLHWDITDIYLLIDTYHYPNTFEVSIEVSDDLQKWITILDNVAITVRIDPYAKPMLDSWQHISLEEPIKKRYWKVTISTTTTLKQQLRVGLFLKPKGEPIKFIVAPPQDAVITMNARTSIPYKDEKHVIDISGVLSV